MLLKPDIYIYSFSTKKGETDGLIYVELASSRPNLVLKVYIQRPNVRNLD